MLFIIFRLDFTPALQYHSSLPLLSLYPPDNWHHGQHEERPAPAPCKVRRDLRHAGWLRADPAVHAADGWQCDQAAGGFAWLGWGQSGPGIHRWSNSKRRVLQVRSRKSPCVVQGGQGRTADATSRKCRFPLKVEPKFRIFFKMLDVVYWLTVAWIF